MKKEFTDVLEATD